MTIEKGYKIVISSKKGKSHIEITRHKTSYMNNILIINSIDGKKYKDTWIIEKDLAVWISSIKKDGYEIIKTVEDVESPKKNTKNKK